MQSRKPLDLDQIAADINAAERFDQYAARHRVCTVHAPRMLERLRELETTLFASRGNGR